MKQMLRAGVEQDFRLRTRLLSILLAAAVFGTLIGRLYYLQIVEGEWYREKASGQQLRDTVIPAARGEIVSADGAILATNATCWTIRASPREIADKDVEKAAVGVSKILGLDEAKILTKFQDRVSNDCLLKYRVDRQTADAVRAFCTENGITGILINQDSKRYYPEGEFLASVLGFTNVDNVGVSGLELEYNSVLTGTSGKVLTAANAWGFTMEQSYATIDEPVQGNTLDLTIDSHIQHYLENALQYAVNEHHVAARSVGIVMNVKTGAILAMSTTPAYDPNQPRVIYDEAVRAYVESLPESEQAAARQLAQQTQWRNKAVSDLYEPGSVFKLITCSSALDAGVVTPNSGFFCGSSINVAGTKFHCANNKQHGAQTLTQALMNSCNQSFIQVGQRLGKEKFCAYFEAYGLRGATGIDLPAEPKKSEFYTADKMGPVELASCSFGQSSKISYIQMATAACAVVNGGNLMQPYVVARVTDTEGHTVRQVEPTIKHRVISAETSATMCDMMEQVVNKGGGHNAQIPGYRVGGKSGTSQKLDSEDSKARISSFLAVAPMEDPTYLVMVCLDEAHSWTTAGGSLSAPVCAEVLEKILEYEGIPRDVSLMQEQKSEQVSAEEYTIEDGDTDEGL
jgi:stage V sporulation protein D (sporulation-specific penicillin-binding protein)